MNHIASLLPLFPQQFVSHHTNTQINNQTTMNSTDFNDDFTLDDLDADLTPQQNSPLSLSPIPSQPQQEPLSSQTALQLEQMIVHIEEQLAVMKQLLAGQHTTTLTTAATPYMPTIPARQHESMAVEQGEVIEGIFTGSEMLSTDGKTYPISPNYASKSKLIEGDVLKLTISPSGAFLYKQIGPIPRRHIKGSLLYDAVKNQWTVLAEGRAYKLLTASVTFHKGHVGDMVVIIVPENGASEWAALEHVIGA